MSISAFIPVYNEEKRIEFTLQTLRWCDEIIILDKESTDRTREIAAKFNCKIYSTNNSEKYESNEFDFLKYCSSDWIIIFTASDIIHPELANKIKELTGDSNFEYDILEVPFLTFILGIDSKRSPWHTDLKPFVYRKCAIEINTEGVHDAIQFNSKRNYQFEKSQIHCIYHLTHETVDSMMDRHLRYWRGEADYFTDENLKQPFKKVISTIVNLIIRKKTFLMGWDGVMLMFTFLTYYMMSFVYKWEKKRSKSLDIYSNIRKDINIEWDKYKI